jgi:hypothetical protein
MNLRTMTINDGLQSCASKHWLVKSPLQGFCEVPRACHRKKKLQPLADRRYHLTSKKHTADESVNPAGNPLELLDTSCTTWATTALIKSFGFEEASLLASICKTIFRNVTRADTADFCRNFVTMDGPRTM